MENAKGVIICFLIAIGLVGVWHVVRWRRRKDVLERLNKYNDIEPLDEFNWQETEHVKLRPFKPIYHLTMGLQTRTMSDLILMDNTYREMIELRRKLIAQETDEVVACNPVAEEAVQELYVWLFGTYLPKRYPSMFKIVGKLPVEKTRRSPTRVCNLVMEEMIILDPIPEPLECLKTLGRHIDCEFVILLPTASPQGKTPRIQPTDCPKVPYHLHAFVVAFPSGFTTTQKLGLSLAGIHAPVPGYAVKLERSMDKFFSALPFGKLITRANWSISTNGLRFQLESSGYHAEVRDETSSNEGKPNMAAPTYEATPIEILEWKTKSKAIDGDACFLRMERQTLHRLERTGAIVFGFKTFLEPLSKLREEGSGPTLAAALQGLAVGSVPAMDVYKNGVIWKDPLTEYLMR